MRSLNGLDWLAMILLIIGGLNWGLVGAMNFNLVTQIFGTSMVTTVIYVLVGLSALYVLFSLGKLARR